MSTVINTIETEPGMLDLLQDTVPATLTTTLYDLVAAIQADVDPNDETLVVATVFHLLHSGRATWCRQVAAGASYEPVLVSREGDSLWT